MTPQNLHAWVASVFPSIFCVMAEKTVKMAQMKHNSVVSPFKALLSDS